MRPRINLFNNPIVIEIEKQDASFQFEVAKQIHFHFRIERMMCGFWKTLPVDKYPLLRDFALKTLCSERITFVNVHFPIRTVSNQKKEIVL